VLTLEQRFGAAAFALSPAQINEAAWAVQNLPAGTSLTDAVKFFNRHHRQADQARRVSEVAAEIVAAKTLSGRHRRYVARLARDWRRFAADLGDPRIHDVSIRIVREWLDDHKQFSVLRDLTVRTRVPWFPSHGSATRSCCACPRTDPRISEMEPARENRALHPERATPG
jgi:hypothetical protein